MVTNILGISHRSPSTRLPPGSCDTHVHVFGPPASFPMSESRTYTPEAAPVEALAAHQGALGLDRVIVVQPSIYDTDNACTLDAIARIGSGARGVAVIDRTFNQDDLEKLQNGGIVGIRLNMAAVALEDTTQIRRDIEWAFAVTEKMGWLVQIFTELNVIAAMEPVLRQTPVPIVIDHFGRAQAAKGASQAGLDKLIGLVGSGKAYAKLSAPYLVSSDASLADVPALIQAFVSANPDRLLWGSNWPHPGGGTGVINRDDLTPLRPIDDGQAIDEFAKWIGDPITLKRIFVDNPARLFGFAGQDGSNL